MENPSRLYVENGAYFMTATLPAGADGDHPVMSPVTFVLAGNQAGHRALSRASSAFQTFRCERKRPPQAAPPAIRC